MYLTPFDAARSDMRLASTAHAAKMSGIMDSVIIEYSLQLGHVHSQPGSGRMHKLPIVIVVMFPVFVTVLGWFSTRVYVLPGRTISRHSEPQPHFFREEISFRAFLQRDWRESRRRYQDIVKKRITALPSALDLVWTVDGGLPLVTFNHR